MSWCSPLRTRDLKQRAFETLDILLSDNTNARMMLPDTSYQHVSRRGRAACTAQLTFYRRAQERLKAKQEGKRTAPSSPFIPRRKPEPLTGSFL